MVERAKAKVEKGTWLALSEMQGQTTKRKESVSATQGAMGIASTVMLASLSTKGLKGEVKVESESSAAQKKKQKGPQVKGAQSIASMVARDLKLLMKNEKDHQEGESGNEKDDMSLFNLVRGGSKKRVNVLCTSVEGGDYVPTRCLSFMINA